MRDYAKGSPRFWTGDLGRKLRGDPEAQALAWYLITAPNSNMLGLYHLPLMYAAADLGWGLEATSKGLRRLSEAHFCEYDESSEVVFIVEGARHECGETLKPNDNRVKAIAKILSDHRKSSVFRSFVDRYGEGYAPALRGLEGAWKGLRTGSEGVPPQKQEQEQKKKQEKKKAAADGGPTLHSASENPDTTSGEVVEPPAADPVPLMVEFPCQAEWRRLTVEEQVKLAAKAPAGLDLEEWALQQAKMLEQMAEIARPCSKGLLLYLKDLLKVQNGEEPTKTDLLRRLRCVKGLEDIDRLWKRRIDYTKEARRPNLHRSAGQLAKLIRGLENGRTVEDVREILERAADGSWSGIEWRYLDQAREREQEESVPRATRGRQPARRQPHGVKRAPVVFETEPRLEEAPRG